MILMSVMYGILGAGVGAGVEGWGGEVRPPT